MKQIGSVEVPQEAFMAVLKMDDQDNARNSLFPTENPVISIFWWRKICDLPV